MSNKIPRLSVSWKLSDQLSGFAISKGIFAAGTTGKVNVGENLFSSIMEHIEYGDRSVLVIGSPIIDGVIDRKRAAEWIASTPIKKDEYAKIDGEFLIFLYEYSTSTFIVLNDRHASYPFFWAVGNGEFAGSYVYLDIAKKCSNWPGFSLLLDKAFEFFVLQRLMGTKTHDSLTEFLPAASLMLVNKDGLVKISQYWNRSSAVAATKSTRNYRKKFIELFQASVTKRLVPESVDSTTSIFLSGGHDSRLVAAYANQKLNCVTLSFADNFEVDCAREISSSLRCKHHFEKLNDNYFENRLDDIAYLSSGMYAIDHALFLKNENDQASRNMVFLHGHGLDYMFQGMYLLATRVKILGRSTFLKRIAPIPKDLAKYFIESISFRLKHDYKTYFKTSSNDYNECENNLSVTVKKIEEEAKNLGLRKYEIWEYLIFHQPSRHYTFSNVLSKRSRGEVRTPTFDTELSDFYFSLPLKYRIDSRLMVYAMKNHWSGIDKIPAGNHGIPAGYGVWRRTFIQVFRKILKEITRNPKYSAPSDADRTWPDRASYIKSHPKYWSRIKEPLRDRKFKEFLNFIDWEKLELNEDRILDEPEGGSFMVTLFSYYFFFKSCQGKD